MRLDIDENSLHDMLQSKKDYIGGSWISGIVNIVGGMSFVVTIYSAKVSLVWINVFLYILACFLIVLGIVQFLKKVGKKSYLRVKSFALLKSQGIPVNS